MSVRRLVATAIALVAALAAASSSARQWTDDSGSYQVDAELVSVRNGQVYLEKPGGDVIRVPLARLSKKDLRYLASLPECQDYFKQHPLLNLEQPDGPPSPRKAKSSGRDSSGPRSEKNRSVIHVDDASTVGEVRRFRGASWGAKSLAFSPDGRFLAVGNMDRSLMVFDVDKSQRVAYQDHLDDSGSIQSLAFAPDGKTLLSGGSSGRIAIWRMEPNGLLTEAGQFLGHSDGVKTITVSRDGKLVLSGGDDKRARCWTLADRREQFVVGQFERPVLATFITRGAKQALATDGQEIRLVDVKKGETIQTMDLGRSLPHALTVAPDGSRIVVSTNYSLVATEIRTGQGLLVFQDTEIQWSVAFLPNSRFLLSGVANKVNLWSLKTQSEIHEFDVPDAGYVQLIAASPDGRHFAVSSGLGDKSIVVYRMPGEVTQR